MYLLDTSQFERTLYIRGETLGRFYFRPLKIPEDIPLIHSWVTQPYAKFWGLQGASVATVENEYRRILSTCDVYIGSSEQGPTLLMEVYDPANESVGRHYSVADGDAGMHILVAPSSQRKSGYTWQMFTLVMDFLFSSPKINRVVVEPDSCNHKIHALNQRAGFIVEKQINLPEKSALLSFCTRNHYQKAMAKDKDKQMQHSSPEKAVTHLTSETWAQVNCQLIGKMLSEFAHERLLFPETIGESEPWTDYELKSGNNICYRFKARILMLEHWWIDTSTLCKIDNQQPASLDAMAFVEEFSVTLGFSPEILPTYLEEIASTLYSSAYKLEQASHSAQELVFSDYQTIEAAMTEGHPSFVANNGRIGFTAEDYRQFAPETGTTTRLLWVAARKSRSVFSTINSLSYEQLITEELGEKTLGIFTQAMAAKELDLNEYVMIPVHPWQWSNKLVYLYAADIAACDLVYLGEGEDNYQPQQSIRTFFNISHRDKRYVKVALSILNMGFMRGLSPYYMKNTPAINQWVSRVIEKDPFLASTGFQILQEVAAVGFANKRFEVATDASSPYRKMLSALWRESPMDKINQQQQLMTMAALLHVDADGHALLPALIKQSGLTTKSWLQHYFKCYLTPLLHCFFAYDMAFMPHGENLILVMENHRPVKVFMKDIAEEVVIMNTGTVLSEAVQRIVADIPEPVKILSIFTDIFDGIFRYLSQILLAHSDFAEQDFWYEVAQCIHHYQRDHPDMADKFARYDLFMPEFTHSCLNQLQIQNNKQMVDLTDPSKNLKFAGTLANPVAEFR